MSDFVVYVGELVAWDDMTKVGKVLAAVAEGECVDCVGGGIVFLGGGEGEEEDGGEGAEVELRGHLWKGNERVGCD